jgi:phosphoglycolate phosphatase-like HAD superfamily hydrolase
MSGLLDDTFEELFSAMRGRTGSGHDTLMRALLKSTKEQAEKQLEYIKQKARRQIDLAYNRALDDAIRALRATPDVTVTLNKLKRTPREVTVPNPFPTEKK